MGAATRFAAGALVLACALSAGAADAPDPAETRALHALFERQWEDEARRFPVESTYRGDLRFNHLLGDQSEQAIADYDAHVMRWLAEARAIRADRLGPTDRVSRALKIDSLQRSVDEQAFEGYRTLMLGALGGAQTEFADLMRMSPLRTFKHGEDILARMAAYPRQMEQQIAYMRKGMGLGWVSARPVLERVVAQIDGQLPSNVEDNPFYAPFKRMPSDMPAAEAERLRAGARAAIAQHVEPAMRRLRAFVVNEYMPKAPPSGAMRGYPDGAKVYDMAVRHSTTTRLTAAEVHAIGLRELARIRAEMDAIRAQVKFDGDFAQFVRHLNSDPKFFHAGPDALLAGYRDIAKRIDAEMPRLFAELPRAPYGVRAMPAHEGASSAEYYSGPALDGSRGGWFNANVLAWRIRPIWGMATLTAHEAVPGHHLQIARSQEMKGLPDFRRVGGYGAFMEGWAVYAETLGHEIGLYDDPYARFGHLQWQALRAARLVVDTGIHSLGWTRDQSIAYMVERTGMDASFISQEVDRYTSWPAQALGYMIGKLKIDELRDRAKAKLGAKFDIRRFHNVVIDNGAVPLDVLETLVEEWVASQTR